MKWSNAVGKPTTSMAICTVSDDRLDNLDSLTYIQTYTYMNRSPSFFMNRLWGTPPHLTTMYNHVYIYIHVCMYVYIYMYVCIYTYIYMYVCIYIYIHMYVYTHIQVRI